MENKEKITDNKAVDSDTVLCPDIQKLERFEMPKIGVYFLFNKDNLIYIGQSINIFRRLNQHIKNKNFDSYSFIKCDTDSEAIDLEKMLIKKYRPTLNIQHKTQDLNDSIEFHLRMIKKLNDQKEYFGIL